MMNPKKTWIQRQEKKTNEQLAAAHACELLESNGMLSIPVDPFQLAAVERRRLRLIGADLKNRCDGQLEYHRDQDLFVLFYNNRYDLGRPDGTHHARTRFSVAHELAHFYLEHHRAHLMCGGQSHPSTGEFSSNELFEREADSFAASLLMPSALLRPIVNQGELCLDRIEAIASRFQTSLLSTAIRSVQHSDFPCEVVGIRGGQIAWRFRPNGSRDPLKEGGCYTLPIGTIRSKNAALQWQCFLTGASERSCLAGKPTDWFRLYGPAQREFTVWEHYLPISIMNTLVVLLTVTESELFDLDSIDCDPNED